MTLIYMMSDTFYVCCFGSVGVAHHINQRRRKSENKSKPKVNYALENEDFDIEGIIETYKEVVGRSPPKSRMNDLKWITKKVDSVQDLMDDVEKLGYHNEYKEKKIKEFIRNQAKKLKIEIKKTEKGYRNATEMMLKGLFIGT